MARLRAADTERWEAVCAQLSWSGIRDAYRAVRGLAEHDCESIALMIVAAGRRWALDDIGHIVAVEQRVLAAVPQNDALPADRWPFATKDDEAKLLADGARVFKGFVDLMLLSDPATRAGVRGDTVVVDWKTAGDVGPTWRERLQHSWQGRLYCWATGAKRCVFRGVQRDGRTAEVVVGWPIVSPVTGNVAFDDGDAENYVRQAFAIRDSQVKSPKWIRHSPWACHAFGRPCEFYDDCMANETPAGAPESGTLSYSSIETLLLCAERFRLSKILATADAEDDSRTLVGRAFHAGIEQLYQQLRRIA